MRSRFFRSILFWLCLAGAPLAGLWLGEGFVPIISPLAAIPFLLLPFAATFFSPSTRKLEKFFVLIATWVLFAGGWSLGLQNAEKAFDDCLKRSDNLREELYLFHYQNGSYPERLDALGIDIPGQRRLHDPLLVYRQEGGGYRLSFSGWDLQYEATQDSHFEAHRK